MSTNAHDRITTVFPDATGAPVHESLGTLFRQSLRQSIARNPALLLAWLILQAVIPLLLLDGNHTVSAAITGAIALVWAIIFIARSHRRAADAFWSSYCRARGLIDVGGVLHARCPLYSRGDKRRFIRVMRGRMGAMEASLAHYTYTEVTQTEDGTSESHYPYTVVQFALPAPVAARFRGVYLRPDSLSFGRLQDALAHDREVRLESAGFNKRYDLRVVDDQDDIALYELFSTPFVDALVTGPRACWEQRDGELVVFSKGHLQSVVELDEFVAGAVMVCNRYLEEHT